MDRQNLTIGCLSVSGVLLLAALFAVSAFRTPDAMASGMIHTSGPYTMLTGQLDQTNELVYLINSRTGNMAVYRLNESRGNLELTHVLPLGASGAAQQGAAPTLKP